MLVVVLVLVLENPDRFAIRLTEQISCRKSVSLRSRNPNAPRTSTTTIPNVRQRIALSTLSAHRLHTYLFAEHYFPAFR